MPVAPETPDLPALANPRRRRLLYGAVAGAAAAAGAGVAWWRFQPSDADGAALAALWASNFETPQGSPLPLQAFRGRPLLVNFWATWCPPCVEEMPMLDAFYREKSANGWQVLGLAIDQPSAVRTFLSRTPVRYPIGMAGLDGTSLGKALGNSSGGLPFTVVVSADGRLLHRKIGRVSEADLAAWSRPL